MGLRTDFAGHLGSNSKFDLILEEHTIPRVESLPVQKMARYFEQGRYIAMDACSMMALDLRFR